MLQAPLLPIQDRYKADDTGQCVMITVHCPKGLIRIPACTCIMKCLVSVLWFGLSRGWPNQGTMNSNLDHYRLSKFKIKWANNITGSTGTTTPLTFTHTLSLHVYTCNWILHVHNYYILQELVVSGRQFWLHFPVLALQKPHSEYVSAVNVQRMCT